MEMSPEYLLYLFCTCYYELIYLNRSHFIVFFQNVCTIVIECGVSVLYFYVVYTDLMRSK